MQPEREYVFMYFGVDTLGNRGRCSFIFNHVVGQRGVDTLGNEGRCSL